MAEEKTVSKITLTYNDGTPREISKGFIGAVYRNELEGTDEVTFNLVKISGEELQTMVLAVIEFARKAGLLDDYLEGEEDE